MEETVFSKIIAGSIPGRIEYQDEHCAVIHDISPQAPLHLLIVPKKVIPRVALAEEGDALLLGHLLLVARKMAEKLDLGAGFRLIVNNGPHAGEAVPHLHIHLLAGRPMHWPPG